MTDMTFVEAIETLKSTVEQLGVSAEDFAAVISDGMAKLYKVLGGNSVAYGSQNVAMGHYSHAEGYENYNKTETIERRNIEERWKWLDNDTDE